jgi:two-component system CheB/CheR fusion protein
MGVEACQEKVKVYATDIDEEDLEQARQGVYDVTELESLPAALRVKYFRPINKSNQMVFRADLRRVLIFGRHNLMDDAPISRLDLLMCRNTLIYFNREAQEHIMSRFHFAIKDQGYLFLGRSETILTHQNLFKPVKMDHRFFQPISIIERRKRLDRLNSASKDITTEAGDEDARLRLHQVAFDSHPDAQVVIDAHGNLLMINKAARTNLKLDRRDLSRPFRDLELSYRPLELRSLIQQSRENKHPILVQAVERTRPQENVQEYLDVTIIPLWGQAGECLGTTITFRDVTQRQELKTELEQARHELETTHEELQSANEELETSNEELQSTIEELQSTNEEIETMNEELQSTNLELQTINDQLHHRTDELNRLNAFLESILASVDVGVVVINQEFRISLWNRRAEELWGLRAAEVKGRSLLELDIGLPVQELKKPVQQFLAGDTDDEKIIIEAINQHGQSICCAISRTVRRGVDNKPEGVVLLMEEESA